MIKRAAVRHLLLKYFFNSFEDGVYFRGLGLMNDFFDLPGKFSTH